DDDLFRGVPMDRSPAPGRPLEEAEQVAEDYRTTGLSLSKHPMALMRTFLDRRRVLTAARLQESRAKSRVRIAGLVICRQRPPTAKGVAFLSLEDETGISNLVVPPEIFERDRRVLLGSAFLHAEGRVERVSKVVTVQVTRATALRLPSSPSAAHQLSIPLTDGVVP
ncbi:MAG: OB-fold nucleic acid binding domain-containing protein, partial [Myxococcaceae bacterium]